VKISLNTYTGDVKIRT